MIAFRFVFFVTGFFVSCLALAMAFPCLVNFYCYDIQWQTFALSGAMTLFCGLLLVFANHPRGHKVTFSRRDAFVLTAVSWCVLSFFGSLPFILSKTSHSLVDALFEGISGLTTTGASVFKGIDYTSSGILLWRSLLQWFGGIGIVIMALTLMPLLRVGGMDLFRSEFSDKSEKILPRVSDITTAIFKVYGLLTLICFLCYAAHDAMGTLEALCHALSTVSTGGFSTYSLSMGYFESFYIEGVAMIFMISGSLTLLLFVKVWHQNPSALWQDPQVRLFFKILAGAIVALTLWRFFHGHDFFKSLREVSFNVISILSTTGYATSDFIQWGPFSVILFFIFMHIGGCTGSTSGSLKIFRWQLLGSFIQSQFALLRHPHGIFKVRYGNQDVSEQTLHAVFLLLGLYVLCAAALTTCLSLCGLDFMTSFTGAVSALNNIGPGLTPSIGPMGHYGDLPDTAKILLMFAMIVGRLEYVTLLILFSRRFWKL